MGTDYYLADPEAKEVVYIDRCGSDFACAGPMERKKVDGWPPGRVRVITREVFDEVGKLEPDDRHHETFQALAWCAGRRTILLIDDTGFPDERNYDFCFRVNRCYVPGWTGKDWDD